METSTEVAALRERMAKADAHIKKAWTELMKAIHVACGEEIMAAHKLLKENAND